MRDSSNFERGQIVCVHLAGASVTKMATLLGVSIAPVSKVITAYTNHGKTSSAKRNSVQKRKLSEWDRLTLKRIVSKNHIPTVANVTVQFSVHLEDPLFPQKRSDESFTNRTSMVDLQLLNFRLLETVLKGKKVV